MANNLLLYAQWFERLTNPQGAVRAAWVLIIAALVGMVGWMVYATGGTTYVWAHTIYIPILLAAMLFRVPGALVTAVVAGVMLGPWMPLEVATGRMQETVNWLYRLGFLSLVGAFAGLLFTMLQSQLERLRRLAFEDIETNLPNRLSLEAGTRDAMGGHDSGNKRIYLLSIRIVNFQEVMMTLGPTIARAVARQVADEFGKMLEARGTLYRLNNDSFAVLLPDSSRTQCYEIADQALNLIERPHQIERIMVHLDAHIGVAAFPFHEDSDPEMLIRKSIQALQMAENSGRRWSSYDRRVDEQQQETLTLLGELKPALERDQLELHYQPKVALSDGAVTGFEALVRWRHPQHGMVPPGKFIPAAEQSGLIHPLTRWVLEAALIQMLAWRRLGLETTIAVNISGRNLEDDSFLPAVRDLFQEYAIPAGVLEFELTESSLFADQQDLSRQLNDLRAMGIKLSIDDFGTGYSSLSYLQRLPVETLKIDREFIDALDQGNASSRQIVDTSIVLAHNLGMDIVAEGVETATVIETLRGLGCDTVQGYFCGRPMPAGDAADWLRANGGHWTAH